MPRYPTFSGGGFSQIAQRSQEASEDRKARKAAQKQALLGLGVGAGSNLLGQGLGVFKDLYAHDQARQRQASQQGFASELLKRQQGFAREQADTAYERENPLISAPVSPDFVGPPPQDRLNTVTRLGHLKVAEKNAGENNALNKLVAAKIFSEKEALNDMPFVRTMSPAQRASMDEATLQNVKSARDRLSGYIGYEGFDDALQPPEQRRELIARALGGVMLQGAPEEQTRALARSIPGGVPPETSLPAAPGNPLSRWLGAAGIELGAAFGGEGARPEDLPIRGDEAGQIVEAILSRVRGQGTGVPIQPLTSREQEFIRNWVKQKKAP